MIEHTHIYTFLEKCNLIKKRLKVIWNAGKSQTHLTTHSSPTKWPERTRKRRKLLKEEKRFSPNWKEQITDKEEREEEEEEEVQ